MAAILSQPQCVNSSCPGISFLVRFPSGQVVREMEAFLADTYSACPSGSDRQLVGLSTGSQIGTVNQSRFISWNGGISSARFRNDDGQLLTFDISISIIYRHGSRNRSPWTKKLFILYHHCHGCWCSINSRSQGIRSHGMDLVLEYSGLNTRSRCNMAFIEPMHRNKPNYLLTYLNTRSVASLG